MADTPESPDRERRRCLVRARRTGARSCAWPRRAAGGGRKRGRRRTRTAPGLRETRNQGGFRLAVKCSNTIGTTRRRKLSAGVPPLRRPVPHAGGQNTGRQCGLKRADQQRREQGAPPRPRFSVTGPLSAPVRPPGVLLRRSALLERLAFKVGDRHGLRSRRRKGHRERSSGLSD